MAGLIVHPQPMDIDPGEDPSSLFSAEHPTEQPESLSVDREPDHSDIISKFAVTHQNQITPYFSHPDVKTVLSNASILLKTLEQRSIQLSMNRGTPPRPTLFLKLERFNIFTEHQACSGYFQKANVFFLAVGKTINKTGSLPSMLKSKDSVTQFTRMEDGDVASIAASPFLKQISSMCHGKGLPEKAKVEAFLKRSSPAGIFRNGSCWGITQVSSTTLTHTNREQVSWVLLWQILTAIASPLLMVFSSQRIENEI